MQEDGNPLAKCTNNEGGGVVRNVVTTYVKYSMPDHVVANMWLYVFMQMYKVMLNKYSVSRIDESLF